MNEHDQRETYEYAADAIVAAFNRHLRGLHDVRQLVANYRDRHGTDWEAMQYLMVYVGAADEEFAAISSTLRGRLSRLINNYDISEDQAERPMSAPRIPSTASPEVVAFVRAMREDKTSGEAVRMELALSLAHQWKIGTPQGRQRIIEDVARAARSRSMAALRNRGN